MKQAKQKHRININLLIMIRAVLLAVLAASTSAFTVTPPAFTARNVDVPTTARFVILSDEETQKILQSGEECIASECSVDDVASLVEELKMQEGILSGRLVKIMNMIAHLQHVNEKKERKTDEVRQFVKDMLRVFSHESPSVFPAGWAGDIGDGPTTAYDALEPKKWTPADKK